jgi:hypothetical protein
VFQPVEIMERRVVLNVGVIVPDEPRAPHRLVDNHGGHYQEQSQQPALDARRKWKVHTPVCRRMCGGDGWLAGERRNHPLGGGILNRMFFLPLHASPFVLQTLSPAFPWN